MVAIAGDREYWASIPGHRCQRRNAEIGDATRLRQPERGVWMRSGMTLQSLLAVPAASPVSSRRPHRDPPMRFLSTGRDAVINSLKPKARGGCHCGHQWTWLETTRRHPVRVNRLGTSWGCRDILDVVEACPRLDYILLPKCEAPGDVHAVEVMIRSAEVAASSRELSWYHGLDRNAARRCQCRGDRSGRWRAQRWYSAAATIGDLRKFSAGRRCAIRRLCRVDRR